MRRPTLSALMGTAGFSSITPIPYVRAYPANLVIEEFNVWPALMRRLGHRTVAFPWSMGALCAFAERTPHS